MIGEQIETNIAGGLDIPLPSMVPVRVTFDSTHLKDIPKAVAKEIQRPDIRVKIKPGQTIAVGCGSRGINNIALIAKTVVSEIKALGGKPFIFPAMGSHGGATAEGQRKVLEGYGITEAAMGCPIRATMETVELGRLDDGMPVVLDRFAAEADGIVLINRIKPHTNFRAPIESGILKMMTIGIGKISGAATLHTYGMDSFDWLLPKVGKLIMSKRPFLFGVGIVENAYDDTAIIEAIPAETLFERETLLQAKSKTMIGRLLFDEIDVLIIDQMGKNISGAGFDPNVTGRNNRWVPWEAKPLIQKIVVLDLTPETKGNATGLGLADVITMKIFKQLDVASTYANVITSAYLDGGAIPIIMNTEREAIQLALKAAMRVKVETARVVRIKNTLEVAEIQVSEAMLSEVRKFPNMQVLGPAVPFQFDNHGNLRQVA
ncbi:MAG: nickel-dependent lactate racemase [Deltaproteobacteria bacterium]|nr:nickel-dependent lactate racemase [Deltaproteobacteria bacterium]